jgi:hypothetical protein
VRLQALAASTGKPLQINGLEEHLLSFLVEMIGGEEALGQALYWWEQKVEHNLDAIEQQVRFAKITQPGGPLPHRP